MGDLAQELVRNGPIDPGKVAGEGRGAIGIWVDDK
jgi:hypothetical protein